MRPLKILFTNNTLDARAGTELWIRDMAIALQARGHQPAAYSSLLGAVAGDLEAAGIDVYDDIDRLPWQPDILHAQHHLEAMTALVRFPSTPAVFACHGAVPWEEEPPVMHPHIQQWIAVDCPSHERLVNAGVAPDRITVLYNFIDTERFTRRAAPLPLRPERALVFNNQIDKSAFRVIERACQREDVAASIAGIASGNPLERPEEVLGSYDIVFAKGRSGLESMASGCAVILIGDEGLGPYVHSSDLDRLRDLNFGMRTLTEPHSVDAIRDRIRAYDTTDAERVTDWIREHASLDDAATKVERIYEKCLAGWNGPAGPDVQARAVARYLATVSIRVKYHEGIRRERDHLAERLERLSIRRLLLRSSR